MKNPTLFRPRAYTGNRRRIHPVYVHYTGQTHTVKRAPAPLCVLMLAMFAVLTLGYLSRPAFALDLDDNPSTDLTAPQPTTPKALPIAETTAPATLLSAETSNPTAQSATDATYIYISCPIEIYRGTLYENEPAEYLVDDFEELPEHWLYVLTPLKADENYFFTLDLACRTENSRFEGQISATYSSYVPDDGSLGSVRIEATEEIAPNTFLVYYGEIKYISDGTINLVPNSYGNVHNHHLFYFSLTTTDLPDNTQPLSEQRVSRLNDPAVSANISLIGDAERLSSVYDEDLLQSDYMYPYRKYDPAEGSRPDDLAAPASASLSC